MNDSFGTKKYKIEYDVENAITKYKDCEEFYWMFMRDASEKSISKLSGTIKLPKGVSQNDNLKVCLHGDLNGEIQKISNDEVYFEFVPYSGKKYAEARIVVINDNLFDMKIEEYANLKYILAEESKWANEANKKRENYKILFFAFYGVASIGIFASIIAICTNMKKLKESPNKRKNIEELDYYRDIDDMNASSSQIAARYNMEYTNVSKMCFSSVITATLLDLCLKNYFKIEKYDIKTIFRKSEDYKFIIDKTKNREELNFDNKFIYDFLCSLSKDDGNSFCLEDLREKVRFNFQKTLKDFEILDKNVADEETRNGNFDISQKKA